MCADISCEQGVSAGTPWNRSQKANRRPQEAKETKKVVIISEEPEEKETTTHDEADTCRTRLEGDRFKSVNTSESKMFQVILEFALSNKSMKFGHGVFFVRF